MARGKELTAAERRRKALMELHERQALKAAEVLDIEQYDPEEEYRRVPTRTKLAQFWLDKYVELHRQEADRAPKTVNNLNLVQIVPRATSAEEWEQTAAALEDGTTIDVEVEEAPPEGEPDAD